MSKLKLQDLKEQGLELSKSDAQELHSIISRIAQHGHEINEVFPGTGIAKIAGPIEVVQKKLTPADFRGDKGKVLKEQGFKVGDMYPPTTATTTATPPAGDGDQETEERAVTQEDLDADPTLASEKGLKVGDTATFLKPKSE